MPKATPRTEGNHDQDDGTRKRKRGGPAAEPHRQRAALPPTLTNRLGVCCGVDFDPVTGIPRPCALPPVKAHGLCAFHVENFDLQQLWRAILRPDWRDTLTAFSSAAVPEAMGKRIATRVEAMLPPPDRAYTATPAPTPTPPRPTPQSLLPAGFASALSRFGGPR